MNPCKGYPSALFNKIRLILGPAFFFFLSFFRLFFLEWYQTFSYILGFNFFSLPTISIWDLFSVKNPIYGFHYFEYKHISYYFAQNKNLVHCPPVEIRRVVAVTRRVVVVACLPTLD